MSNQLTQLGAAILAAQRFEFCLYGIAAHVSHLPDAQKDRRLRELDGEKFIRSDPSELKMTLGQLSMLVGKSLLLDKDRLDKFVADRNLVAHNFYRTFYISFEGAPARTDADSFLSFFITEALWWNEVVEGLLYHLLVAFAHKEGRAGEVVLTDAKRAAMATFEAQVIPTA